MSIPLPCHRVAIVCRPRFAAVGPKLPYCAVQPPSIGSAVPVIDAAASLHRNTDSAPICSVVTNWRVGWACSSTSLIDLLLRDAARLGRLGDLLLHQRREHVAGADGVGGDAVLGRLQRHRLGQADEAVLGGDVGRLEGRCDQAMRGGDVDDAPPFAALHLGHHGADGVERRGQVDGDDRVPLGDRESLDRLHVLDAGVVDEDVDLAERAAAFATIVSIAPASVMSAAE